MKVALCSSGWFTYAGSTVYETETQKLERKNFELRELEGIFLESTFSTTAWFKERRAL